MTTVFYIFTTIATLAGLLITLSGIYACTKADSDWLDKVLVLLFAVFTYAGGTLLLSAPKF